MIINYVFRSKKRKEFSIENVFGNIIPYFQNDGLDVEQSYLPCGQYNNLNSILENLNYVKTLNGDIIHITGEIHFVAIALRKKKVVLTIHDIVGYEQSFGLKRLLWKYLWLFLPIKIVNYAVCISEKTKKDIIKLFPEFREKLIVIPNSYGDYLHKVEKEFNNSKPIIMAVGTRQNKNLERIIYAIKDINCKMLIIGKIDKHQYKLLQENDIEYDNYYNLTNTEVFNAYCKCDIVCFPSLYEGFGMPIIEAQVVGRPIITSELEPMKSVAGEGGLLVNPVSTTEIHNAINRLITDEKFRRDLVLKGYQNAAKYSPNVVKNQYMDIYNLLMNDNIL